MRMRRGIGAISLLRWVGSDRGRRATWRGWLLARREDWTEVSRGRWAKYKGCEREPGCPRIREGGYVGGRWRADSPVREGSDGCCAVRARSGRLSGRGTEKREELPMEFNPPRHWRSRRRITIFCRPG